MEFYHAKSTIMPEQMQIRPPSQFAGSKPKLLSAFCGT
jgi:hypothetical protein